MQLLRRTAPRLVLPLLPALATLALLLLVVVANERIVARDLAQRAVYRVTQNANIFADQTSRTLSRRAVEMELTGRFLLLRDHQDPSRLTAELTHLKNKSSAYAWIGWTAPDGRLLAASSGLTPSSPLNQPLLAPSQSALRGPQLLIPQAVPGLSLPGLSTALGILLVPVGAENRRPVGTLVAVLDPAYFESMRQFILGDAQARRSLNLALMAPGNRALLGSTENQDEHFQAQAALRAVDAPLEMDWTVVASQPRATALSPAARLQDNLLFWGVAAALLVGGVGIWLARRLAWPYQAVFDAVSKADSTAEGLAPGGFLLAVAEALRRLAPSWNLDDSTQALLEHMIQDAQRLQQVLDQLPTPAYLLDEAERVRFWNRQAETVFGWPAGEALGRPIDELLPGQVHASAAAAESHDGQPQAFEAKTTTRLGEVRWGEWRLLPLLSPDGHPRGQIVLVRDITDRVQATASMARHQDDLAELNRRLMQQEQDTTQRLAQTLHDQLGQTLGAVRLAFDSLKPVWSQAELPRHRERAERLDRMIDQAVAEVRHALMELRPPLLKELGLAAALDNEIKMRRNEVAPTALQLLIDPVAALTRWPADVEHAAFMIAREAIANAARHANAQQIWLNLDGQPGQLTLRIDDNGQGIAPDSRPHHPGHLGLVGMRERALAIGARLDVTPAEPQGLSVTLRWPADPPPIAQPRDPP